MKRYLQIIQGLAAICLVQLLITRFVFAQWHSCGGPDGGYVYKLASGGGNLYAAAYELYISSNNGASWLASPSIGLPPSYSVGAMTTSGDSLYLSSGNLFTSSLFLSTDGGNSFTDLSNGYTLAGIHTIAVQGSTIYVGATAGVLYTSNGGVIWTLVNSGLTNIVANDILINGASVFAATSSGVFVTTNNGTSWSLTSLQNSISSFVINGTDIYAAGDGVYLSSDGGFTWTAVNTGLPSDFSAKKIILNNNNLFVCDSYYNYYGNYVTPVSSINWQQKNNGMNNTYLFDLTSLGTDIYSCSYSGGVFKTVNNGNYWTSSCRGIHTMINLCMAVDSPAMYAGSYINGVFRSDDYGNSWIMIDSGLPKNSTVNTIAADNNNVFICIESRGVYKSANGGTTWNHIGQAQGLTDTVVNVFAVKGNYVYAGTHDSGVYVSSNSGTSWTKMNYGLSASHINSLAISDTVVYAGGYTSDVFRSYDHGATWQIFNSGLSTHHCTQIAAGGSNVYAAVDGQVYKTNNGLTTWSSTNIPNPGAQYGDWEAHFIGAQNSNVFAVKEYYGSSGPLKFTIHSIDAADTWIIDTFEMVPETTYCIIVNAAYAFMGTGDNSVWCFNDNATGINSVTSVQEADVFPNPSSGIFYLEMENHENGNVIVTDLFGRIKLLKTLNAFENEMSIDLSDFPQGIYLYQISDGEKSWVGKLIRQ